MRKTAAVLGFALAAASVLPCAVICPRDQAVTFQGQRNVIIWDEKNKVQHFMREAHFTAKQRGFSFLAPTPTLPEIEEVDPNLFIEAAGLAIEKRRNWATGIGCGAAVGATKSAEVLQEKDVAGFRATTLRADDGPAMEKWLKDNDYYTTPAITRWLDYYVKKKWVITAFKVQPEKGQAKTRPIRMSFRTDKPFNPYRVPKDNVGQFKAVGLELYFISRTAMVGTLGDSLPWNAGISHAMTRWEATQLIRMAKLPSNTLMGEWVLTAFADRNFPVADKDDLFFVSDGRIKWGPPAAWLVFAIVVALWWRRRSHKKRAA
jgi:hypothetical protein